MSDRLSDPLDANTLFSPARPVEQELSSDATVPADTSVSTEDERLKSASSLPVQRRPQPCFVLVPSFTSAQKVKYRSVAEDDIESGEEFAHEGLECVVGEVGDGRGKCFYVRYADGVIHKVPAQWFQYRFPDLIQNYEESQAKAMLPYFDPTSSDVHPSSRQATLTVRIPGTKDRVTRPTHPPDDYSSESSDELAQDIQSEDYSDDSASLAKRRSTRTAAATANKKLRGSPLFGSKKTRLSGRTAVVHGSDSDSDILEVSRPTRRSTRVRITRRPNLDDEDFEEEITPAVDSDVVSRGKAMKKKVVRGKASRPAYGHFRVVADLQYDEEENEDIAPLIVHRAVCEKCHTPPTHEQLNKKRRKRKAQSDESEDEETRLSNLGGWVRCLKCPVAAHWGCLAKTQRDEILRAAHELDKAEQQKATPGLPDPPRRLGLETHQTTEFICGSCMKGGICMGCKEIALRPDQFTERTHSPPISGDATPDLSMSTPPPNATTSAPVPRPTESKDDNNTPHELLFRCFTCKRLAHYAHLPIPERYDPEDATPAELASYYQYETGWKCADCFSFVYVVEHILAWRPYPENAVESYRSPNDPPNHKSMLPREYLVKWVDRSYRRVQWVPHGWLLAVAPNKLKNFLQGGTRFTLLPEPVSEQLPSATDGDQPTSFEIGREESEDIQAPKDEGAPSALLAMPDAEKRIPPAWRTVDRVLDIRLWRPKKAIKGKAKKPRLESSDEGGDSDESPGTARLREVAYDEGKEPPASSLVTIEEFESLSREELGERHASKVAWAFFKWDDLGYDDASWDVPPRSSDIGSTAFLKAFKQFIFARSVTILKKPAITKDGIAHHLKKSFTVDNQPELGQNTLLKLMPFQIEGVNWLCHNWFNSQNCILADEMGLGKTVQIVTFIGHIASTFKSSPALVVVPNSTITNWVREFERWAPKLRVVPFYGEAKAREVIKKFELFHSRPDQGTTGAKYHVLVTTYETITNTKDFGSVFKSMPRWELLVVDEGQRLKSDASLLFRRLKELNSIHRIIMTGTPLNNNIRELFNLMNFLDPDQWKDLEGLSKQYEVLTDELVTELHGRLKPYFLRRIKSEVLQLPPKNEVIVPVSMAPLQKEIYRSILSQNLDILRKLAEGNVSSSKSNSAVTKTNMNNVLMQLRKCLQHPYLVSRTIEPQGLLPQEAHERLIGASAKLRLLKMLLPKLRARGHRVLLFSQFTIALDIVEDFLDGEGIKFLRLDGNTKQAERQKGMDEFNKPDSNIFVYLLSTRAGGVGINLWSADTVIIFDPDFNPHQDLQAIARAHRYGQQKTVMVFKLVVKDSAEERIMQTGKKKLALDHLIVQKMDDENGMKEDVQSILMFGAKSLFEENEETAAREVHYSEHDVDSLIEKTEKEGDQVEPDSGAGSLFAFAKVWAADKDSLEEMDDEVLVPEEADSWAKALELIAARSAAQKEQEQTGRGVRRKAAAIFPQQSLDLGDTPTKDKGKEKAKAKKRKKSEGNSDDSDFRAPISDAASGSDATVDLMDVDDVIQMLPIPGSSAPALLAPKPVPKQKMPSRHKQPGSPHRPLSPIQNRQKVPDVQEEFCGLCGKRHAFGRCSMTENPENLAQYRLMLMQHAGDESIEERRAAIQVIDETLQRLGKMHLVYGQPLHPVEAPLQASAPQPRKKPRLDDAPRPMPQTPHGLVIPRNVSNALHWQSVAGSSRLNGTSPKASSSATAAPVSEAVARISTTVNAAASPSRRPASSVVSAGVPKFKRSKDTSNHSPCAVCGQTPHHLVKDCPVVMQGTSSITVAIQRLEKDPAQGPLVDALRSIRTKQQRRALATSAANADPSDSIPRPSSSVIDLTDS